MMPIKRPFLDYVLTALADAGFTDVCLVIGPEHTPVRDYYARPDAARRLRVHLAIQREPRGTADAVVAAESFIGDDAFVVLNADNYYPVDVLRMLRAAGEPAMPAFDRAALIREGNIPPERVARYALLEIAPDGYLARVVEKPDDATFRAMSEHARVSMNVWLLGPDVLEACRRVPMSSRGEVELPN